MFFTERNASICLTKSDFTLYVTDELPSKAGVKVKRLTLSPGAVNLWMLISLNAGCALHLRDNLFFTSSVQALPA